MRVKNKKNKFDRRIGKIIIKWEKKILIADDHQVVLTGISLIIKSGLEDITIDQVENYSDVLEKISQTAYDLLIIIDTDMLEKNLKKFQKSEK